MTRIRRSRRVPVDASERRIRRTGMRYRAAAEKRLPAPPESLAVRIRDYFFGKGDQHE